MANSLVKPLQQAFKTGRTLVSPNFWVYSKEDRADGFTQLFQPLSGCETPDLIKRSQSLNCMSSDSSGGHWSSAPCAFSELRDGHLHMDEAYGRNGAKVLPLKYRARGLFWWVSQVLGYVMRPSDAFAAKLAARKKELGFDAHGPLLGLHVRLGDSCADSKRKGRMCNVLGDYMPSVRKMMASYGFKAVFLATDNAAVLADTAKFPEVKWVYSANGKHQSTDTTDSSHIKSGKRQRQPNDKGGHSWFAHDIWAACRLHKAVFGGWLAAKKNAKAARRQSCPRKRAISVGKSTRRTSARLPAWNPILRGSTLTKRG